MELLLFYQVKSTLEKRKRQSIKERNKVGMLRETLRKNAVGVAHSEGPPKRHMIRIGRGKIERLMVHRCPAIKMVDVDAPFTAPSKITLQP